MLAGLFDIVGAEIGRAIRRLTAKAVVVVLAVVLLCAGLLAGVSLLHLWLSQLLGPMLSLAVTGGACTVLALLLLAVAFHRKSRPRGSAASAASAAAAPSDANVVRDILTAGQRTLDESSDAVQQGSRDAMLAALLLALVEGMSLSRTL